jgi:ribulose-5-phosphate 4-epimerase/fuculose-1-phosphate aldolase
MKAMSDAEYASAQAAVRDLRFLEDQLAMAPQGVPIALVRNATGVAVSLPKHAVMACGDSLRDALNILQLGEGA